ncbi:MAG: lipopolysaccharide transport periplasmic protein LptA [Thermodesulfobacteriota bacterium]
MTNRQGRIILSCIVFFLLCCAPSLWATKAPITIEADRMTSLEQENSVLFSGNVDARQADVRIRTDKMTVYYTNAGKGEKQEVKRLKCIGNVEITKGEWLGTGREMNYLAQERKVVLNGNAKAWQDTNLVTGDTIIYYLDEGRSEVVAGKGSSSGSGSKKSGRVKATLTPQ